MILEIDHLTKSYLQGETPVEALSDVSFAVDKGETLAIVGPSGSGKTTLLSLLAGLEEASKGNIVLSGSDITKMSENELALFRAKSIGIIFQQFHLMPQLTALENVSLPLEILGHKDAEKKAKEALEIVGLGHRMKHSPHQMSGGECQRVAIARALVVEPEVLLADEPSGNLDEETGKQVTQFLFDLVEKRKMTLLLVTHDLDLAKRCGRQIHLKGGRLQ